MALTLGGSGRKLEGAQKNLGAEMEGPIEGETSIPRGI